ncbi:MAG: hypothetical protein R6X25_01720 [Candidatus Krumholzibacteriia bacterium]
MSKFSKLKQQAYQAGKRRNWEEAVSIYEKLVEADKNNPTLINELGDISLKTGETQRAIRHFLNAASKYRGTGLLNNAVAIYKKILRHDADNVNAHWYLAEIRSSQGLSVEGERHALRFLECSESQTGDVREIFDKRCEQLLSLYPRSAPVLEHLLGVFRVRKREMEQARVRLLLAGIHFDAGQEDSARAVVESLLEELPELVNYAEFGHWQKHTGDDDPRAGVGEPAGVEPGRTGSSGRGGSEVQGAWDATMAGQDGDDRDEPADPPRHGQIEISSFAAASASTDDTSPADARAHDRDFGDIDIGAAGAAGAAGAGGEIAEEAGAADGGDGSPAEDASSAGSPAEDAPAADAPADTAPKEAAPTGDASADGLPPPDDGEDVVARDLEGRFTIEVDDGAGFSELMADLEGGVAAEAVVTEPAAGSRPDAPDGDGPVDLLAQILAEEDGAFIGGDEKQVSTITAQIGHHVGGADDQNPYDLGLVYLEMGMFDLACDAFAAAAESTEQALSAHEMWGIALLRAERAAEALSVLERGLELPAARPEERLGIMYHAGLACEAMGDVARARDLFEQVQRIRSSFLDVARRLDALSV